MTRSSVARPKQEEGEESPRALYKEGDRVVYKALYGGLGSYAPNEELSGTVIAVFTTGSQWVYRVRLDRVWKKDAGSLEGTQIVVGNVTEDRLAPGK